ncbi:MEK1 interacting protein 1 [Reticulomyxa filosa]|uniref:MEK1 interacting protein 1 n=1 Tax=Reticulomyxa filosa TaxID=46433 RepID=X6NEG1_RETFI|nr:MEK1 interacting protein 1 [Reticulomyxa filosa]|eukprot:ETO24715.1 MEK1 interacting protein 1 [Reticulomyxa filosa]
MCWQHSFTLNKIQKINFTSRQNCLYFVAKLLFKTIVVIALLTKTITEKKKKGEKKLGEKKFRVIASVCIENKTYKVTLTWLSLKLLKDKVKELIITNQHKPKDTEFDFTISDANGQPIDNFSKLRTVFETNPVNFLVNFGDKNNDEEKKNSEQRQEDETKEESQQTLNQAVAIHKEKNLENESNEKDENKKMEPAQSKEWNEANKKARGMVEEMIDKKQKGIVVVATNIDQLAKANKQQQSQKDVVFFFTMMINSAQYMKNKLVISPYTVYLFHSNVITFDDITIDGCVYVIDCRVNGIENCHITQQVIYTEEACFRLGAVHEKHGRYDKAIEYYEKALKIEMDKLESQNARIIDLYNRVGFTYKKKTI